MSTQLRPNSPSRAIKRARSSDQSANGSPAPDTLNVEDEVKLPAFLCQSKAEIDAKFTELNLQQLQRLQHGQQEANEDSPWKVDNSKENRLRNRYLDIKPWEKSRIKLQVPEGTSDYINASPITLTTTNNGDEWRYIATQGPKQTGVNHFWQMIWQEAASPVVIVMLTQLAENQREKCYQYFPEDAESEELPLSFTDSEGTEHSGTLRVANSSYDEEAKSTVRELSLTFDNTSKTIYHLFFLAWPDYGVPVDSDRSALLNLIKLSRDRNEGWTNPRIIHCSAGVGRSGTFIALEHLLKELEAGALDDLAEEEDDPIFDTVNRLREQRVTMVQSDLQYAFIYEILADAYKQRQRELHPKENVVADQKLPAMDRLAANGEPSPKAIRLSRGLRKIFTDIRTRSMSRKRSDNGKESHPTSALAESAPPDGESKGDDLSKTESSVSISSAQGKIP